MLPVATNRLLAKISNNTVMSTANMNHPERLFPADTTLRRIAGELYESVRDLPIVSPHGHTDPAWFALDEGFPDAVDLLIKPDHYVVRMLYSQGISMESLGIVPNDGKGVETDTRKIWRTFAQNYHLFAGTPSRVWLDHVFGEVFGLDELLRNETADVYYITRRFATATGPEESSRLTGPIR
jgi:glucuronate isomerase